MVTDKTLKKICKEEKIKRTAQNDELVIQQIAWLKAFAEENRYIPRNSDEIFFPEELGGIKVFSFVAKVKSSKHKKGLTKEQIQMALDEIPLLSVRGMKEVRIPSESTKLKAQTTIERFACLLRDKSLKVDDKRSLYVFKYRMKNFKKMDCLLLQSLYSCLLDDSFKDLYDYVFKKWTSEDWSQFKAYIQ